MAELIGFIAAFCTTSAFLPQVLKILKTRKTQDISLSMYSVFSLGVLLWLIYGLMLQQPPVVAANAITFVLSCLVLVMKLKHG